MKKDKLLTLQEVKKILRVSDRSMYRYIAEGKLKATKIGYWKISEKDLQDFVKKQSNRSRK